MGYVINILLDDTPYIIVEEMPAFRGGGLEDFHSWILENLRYPDLAV